MGFILWIIFGALTGWLASRFVKGASGGFLMNTVVGIVGAVLGGWVFGALGLGGPTINDGSFSIGSLFVSFVGAVLLLMLANVIAGARKK